jgi:hypothetical protein
MDRGWFKLHRKMIDNPLMRGDYLALWVWLLCEAAHETRDSLFAGKRISLKPGQLTTGRKQAADGSGLSESQTQKLLVKMVLEQQIEQQTSSTNRLITILNWDQYQKSNNESNSKVTTTEQQRNTLKELKKERKEIPLCPDFEAFWSIYPKKTARHKAFESWLKNNPPLDICLKTLEWQKKSEQWQKDRGQFIPLPATWLNQRRWEDEPLSNLYKPTINTLPNMSARNQEELSPVLLSFVERSKNQKKEASNGVD